MPRTRAGKQCGRSECLREYKNMYSRKYRGLVMKRDTTNMNEIMRINNTAKELGMSYGQYVGIVLGKRINTEKWHCAEVTLTTLTSGQCMGKP